MPTSTFPFGKVIVSIVLIAAVVVGVYSCSGRDAAPDATVSAPDAQTTSPSDARDGDGRPVSAVAPRAPEIPVTVSTAHGKLEKVLAGKQRTAAERARDAYRHPMETLEFFGINRGTRVIEITPGEGWYAAILSPMVKSMGNYVAAVVDENAPGAPDYTADQNAMLQERFRSDRTSYDGTRQLLRRFRPDQPVFGEPGTADMVLSFRNAHNWIAESTAPQHFKAAFDVLKPGGTFGLVDHRANPGAPTDGLSGYVTEQQIIELATTAGFRLAARSEFNANAKDTKDYPDGVWTLPPTYALGDKDRAKYAAIGESDRMTLKFVKP